MLVIKHDATPEQGASQCHQQHAAQIAITAQPGEDKPTEEHGSGANQGREKHIPYGFHFEHAKSGGEQQQNQHECKDCDGNGTDEKTADDPRVRIAVRRAKRE